MSSILAYKAHKLEGTICSSNNSGKQGAQTKIQHSQNVDMKMLTLLKLSLFCAFVKSKTCLIAFV